MNLRNKQTGAVVTDGEFRAAFPNTGFPIQITEQTYNEFGYDVVLEGPQAQPTRYQVGFADGVQQIDGKWFTKYSVADMDDEAKAAKDEEQAKSVRNSRTEKLRDCDWTQLDDTPMSNTQKAGWATYRQALRDVPKQAGFPFDIEWPVQPE
jgi:hypothetical protein